jgi:hypothetical protein
MFLAFDLVLAFDYSKDTIAVVTMIIGFIYGSI